MKKQNSDKRFSNYHLSSLHTPKKKFCDCSKAMSDNGFFYSKKLPENSIFKKLKFFDGTLKEEENEDRESNDEECCSSIHQIKSESCEISNASSSSICFESLPEKQLTDKELIDIIVMSGGTKDDFFFIKKWIALGLITPK